MRRTLQENSAELEVKEAKINVTKLSSRSYPLKRIYKIIYKDIEYLTIIHMAFQFFYYWITRENQLRRFI